MAFAACRTRQLAWRQWQARKIAKVHHDADGHLCIGDGAFDHDHGRHALPPCEFLVPGEILGAGCEDAVLHSTGHGDLLSFGILVQGHRETAALNHAALLG